jgi:hypothetical protein
MLEGLEVPVGAWDAWEIWELGCLGDLGCLWGLGMLVGLGVGMLLGLRILKMYLVYLGDLETHLLSPVSHSSGIK